VASGVYVCDGITQENQAQEIAMPMAAQDIARLIKEGIPGAEVEIEDLAGDGDHYAATVISAAFAGKSKVQQHQMVYGALGGRMGGVLHALKLTTMAQRP
jgi:stress-induced morphogen